MPSIDVVSEVFWGETKQQDYWRAGRREKETWLCFLSIPSPNTRWLIPVQHRNKQKGSIYVVMGLLSLDPV